MRRGDNYFLFTQNNKYVFSLPNYSNPWIIMGISLFSNLFATTTFQSSLTLGMPSKQRSYTRNIPSPQLTLPHLHHYPTSASNFSLSHPN